MKRYEKTEIQKQLESELLVKAKKQKAWSRRQS